MIARTSSLLVLLVAGFAVWRPRTLPDYDMDRLEAELSGRFALVNEPFEPNAMLPLVYRRLVATGDGPLRSIYVGFYPTLDLASNGPHDPKVCYPTMGWNVSPSTTLELQVDGMPATVRVVTVQNEAESWLVTWWSQRPGALPVPPDREGTLEDLRRMWSNDRSELIWVRMVWRPELAAPDHSEELQSGIAATIRAVAPGFR